MKTFVISDIHGAYHALMQVLERSSFDYENDKLICLGDVADRGTHVPECFEELLKIKNLVYIRGNHDAWLMDWFNRGIEEYIWLSQGGHQTKDAYELRHPDKIEPHKEFLNHSSLLYHIENEKLFVHAGIIPNKPLKKQDEEIFLWNRMLYEEARIQWEIGDDTPVDERWKAIFIGHTVCSHSADRLSLDYLPKKGGNVWMLDTGAGWRGKLTIMDVDSEEYWQSELV